MRPDVPILPGGRPEYPVCAECHYALWLGGHAGWCPFGGSPPNLRVVSTETAEDDLSAYADAVIDAIARVVER